MNESLTPNDVPFQVTTFSAGSVAIVTWLKLLLQGKIDLQTYTTHSMFYKGHLYKGQPVRSYIFFTFGV